MTGKQITLLATVLALLAAAVLRPTRHTGPSEPNIALTSTSPSASGTASPTAQESSAASVTAAEVDRLLPFPLTQLAAGVQLAQRFTALYSGHRYDQSPSEQLRQLKPLMHQQLCPQVERALTDPAAHAQRQRIREVRVAQARAQAIRAIGPTSVILLVTAATQTTTTETATTTRQDSTIYAITLIRHGDHWQVYELQLAATGNSGQTP